MGPNVQGPGSVYMQRQDKMRNFQLLAPAEVGDAGAAYGRDEGMRDPS